MTNRDPHGEKGHVNVFIRDHDSVITAYGQHDRVVAFLPDAEGLYARVDHEWNLGRPTADQVLTVARKDQGVKGRWTLDRRTPWADGSSTDYHFTRA